MRCLRFAEALRDVGSKCIFVCRDLEGNQSTLVRERGFELFSLAGDITKRDAKELTVGYEDWLPVTELNDATETQAIVDHFGDVSLIVDHYSLGFEWEKALKPSVSKLIVIDDFCGRRHCCDYFINPSIINFDDSSYQDILPETCTKLLGPKFALLDTCFAELNSIQRIDQPGDIEKIFISFGGVDFGGWTNRVLQILSEDQFRHYHLEVVVGQSFTGLDRLERLAAMRGDVKIHCQIDNVGAVMSQCDLAIGAGGTMTWERLCVGIPCVILGIAPNQHEIINALLAKGLCVGLAAAENVSQDYVSFMIRYLIDNQSLRQAISDQGRQYIDGRGLQRVVNLLGEGHIVFRAVTMEDATSIFEWRNHPSVALVSSSGNTEFDFQSHVSWLASVLEDDKRIAVIAEVDGEPMGVCRFDLLDATATISIYTVPEAKKYGGLIKAASAWFFAKFPSITEINAKVLASNKSSQRSFINAKYHLVSSYYKLERPVKK